MMDNYAHINRIEINISAYKNFMNIIVKFIQNKIDDTFRIKNNMRTKGNLEGSF